MTADEQGLDYLPQIEQVKLIGAFASCYGPAPVAQDGRERCYCPACRRDRGEPLELRPDWLTCPGCGQQHPPSE